MRCTRRAWRRPSVERDPHEIAVDFAERAGDEGEGTRRDIEMRATREIGHHVLDDGHRRPGDSETIGIQWSGQ